MGTQLDLLTLFDPDAEKVSQLEDSILHYLGADAAWPPSLVYPRGLDFEVISVLVRLASGPSNTLNTPHYGRP